MLQELVQDYARSLLIARESFQHMHGRLRLLLALFVVGVSDSQKMLDLVVLDFLVFVMEILHDVVDVLDVDPRHIVMVLVVLNQLTHFPS
jgi:hypothetical protein